MARNRRHASRLRWLAAGALTLAASGNALTETSFAQQFSAPATVRVAPAVRQPPPPANRFANQPANQPPAAAQPAEPAPANELAELQELLERPAVVPAMEQQVVSVSRQESTVGKSAAAVFVITQEDIRRSGFRSIAEILRQVPGMHVARFEANTWAVTCRGLNDEFANKLLVLIDGREVYSPAFGGVHWDIVDNLIEDIDRIEVIRGPGATIWGANAVNGVINIYTKKASETQGGLINGGGGSEQRLFGGYRHGGQLNDNTHYRYYVKGFGRSASGFPQYPNDDWRQGRLGFRIDKECGANSLMVDGDVYDGNHGDFNSALASPNREYVFGGHMLTRLKHTIDEDSDWQVQVFYDRQDRDLDGTDPRLTTFVRRQGLFETDFQHRFPIGERHNVIWGGSYRFAHDKFVTGPIVSIDPDAVVFSTYNLFVQDEIELVEDTLFVTGGSKFSWNPFTNFEAQPSGRVSWIVNPRLMGWASIARAVRIPTRADFYLTATFPGAMGPSVINEPNPNLTSEVAYSYETGWRYSPQDWLYLDLALFFTDYEDLRTREVVTLPPPTLITERGSGMYGETYGVELASTVQVTEDWSCKLAYSYLDVEMHLNPGSTGTAAQAAAEGGAPHNMVYFRSSWDLTCAWHFDMALRYVDNVPAVKVPAYFVGDARLLWSPNDRLELSLVAQNFFDNQHPEFTGLFIEGLGTQVQQSIYGMVEYKY